LKIHLTLSYHLRLGLPNGLFPSGYIDSSTKCVVVRQQCQWNTFLRFHGKIRPLYSAFGKSLCTWVTVRRVGSGLYRRSRISLPTTFISAQRLSERNVFADSYLWINRNI
jgi:hypothetical protein